MVMLWVGRVLNNRAQIILHLNKSTPSRLRKQRGCLDQEIYQWIRLVPSISKGTKVSSMIQSGTLEIPFDLINQLNERCKDKVSTHRKEFRRSSY
jgi:hypothetical protein